MQPIHFLNYLLKQESDLLPQKHSHVLFLLVLRKNFYKVITSNFFFCYILGPVKIVIFRFKELSIEQNNKTLITDMLSFNLEAYLAL